MNYNVPSFEERRAQIHTVDDIDIQIKRAKNYVRKLRSDAKKAEMLDEKLKINEFQKEAEKVFRKLRMASFDIEDEINASIA